MNYKSLTAYCKFKYDQDEQKGRIFIRINTDTFKSLKLEGIFNNVPSSNYLAYVATCAAFEYLLKLECKVVIYTPSILAVKQIKGLYKMQTPAFKPFYDYIRKNISENVSIEFMRAKDIKMSPRDTYAALDKKVIFLVESLIKESNSLFKQQPIMQAGLESPL